MSPGAAEMLEYLRKAVVGLLQNQKSLESEQEENAAPSVSNESEENADKSALELLIDYFKEHGMPKNLVVCDNCHRDIKNSEPHYHCSICGDDNFDLCQQWF